MNRYSAKLIPEESQLNAIHWEREKKRQSTEMVVVHHRPAAGFYDTLDIIPHSKYRSSSGVGGLVVDQRKL